MRPNQTLRSAAYWPVYVSVYQCRQINNAMHANCIIFIYIYTGRWVLAQLPPTCTSATYALLSILMLKILSEPWLFYSPFFLSGGPNQIRLPYNPCGCIYAFDVTADFDINRMVGESMSPLKCLHRGIDLQERSQKDTSYVPLQLSPLS